jgi:hypothetical protein
VKRVVLSRVRPVLSRGRPLLSCGKPLLSCGKRALQRAALSRATIALCACALVVCTLVARAQDPVPVPDVPPAPVPQDPPVPKPPQADPPAATAPAATPAAFDYAGATAETAFNAELERLVARHATRARKSSLGTSRSGRDLVLLTLTDLAAGDPDKKPAVLLVTGLDPSFDAHPAGPQAALFAVRDLLERADADPATAAWLARTSVYVVPAPDPDATFAAGGTQARACRLDRNFPAEWKPWSSETCAQGPYPLSEPETRAIARFLTQRANVGAVVLLSRGSDVREAASIEEGELERILYARIAAGGTVSEAAAPDADHTAADALARRSQSFVRESGSLGAFCSAHLAAFVVSLDPFGGAVGDTQLGRAPSTFPTIAVTLARVARELPRLACSVEQSERLRERLWKIDLSVENQGLLATLPESERARCASSVWLEATGGRIAQVGISRGSSAGANATLRPPGAWMIGHLDGREKVKLHVLVEAAEGTSVQLVFRTLREGETRCAVTLH